MPNTSGDRSSETFEQKNIVSKSPGSASLGTLGLKGNLRSVKINGTKTKSIRSTTMAQIGRLEVWLGFQAALSFADESSVILRKRSGGIPYTAMNLLVK